MTSSYIFVDVRVHKFAIVTAKAAAAAKIPQQKCRSQSMGTSDRVGSWMLEVGTYHKTYHVGTIKISLNRRLMDMHTEKN